MDSGHSLDAAALAIHVCKNMTFPPPETGYRLPSAIQLLFGVILQSALPAPVSPVPPVFCGVDLVWCRSMSAVTWVK